MTSTMPKKGASQTLGLPTEIRKRDGRIVDFEVGRITAAIEKAFTACGHPFPAFAAHQVAFAVASALKGDIADVEAVQDLVESALMDQGHREVAKAYILYRQTRANARELDTRLMRTLAEITHSSAKDSNTLRENANVDGDTAMGTMLKYGSESAKQFNLLRVLKPEHAQAHINGDIHIHDLDFYTLTTTCCQIDLNSLFDGGFSTGHGVLRPPKSIQSYAALACIAIQSNQNDQHGGQSIANFDYAMGRGVALTFATSYRANLAKALSFLTELDDFDIAAAVTPIVMPMSDDAPPITALIDLGLAPEVVNQAHHKAHAYAMSETERATYQAMESLIHNLNTMNSRAGAQTPFSSINYGLDISIEGRMVVEQLLRATMSGLGNGETPIFPIQVYRVKAGVNLNPNEPNYDLFRLACACSAKRLFPNFAFQDAPFNAQYYREGHPETEIAYMGCRTRVIGNVHDPEREVTFGRGNLSFTTINLPGLAIGRDEDGFFAALDAHVTLVIDQLLERFAIQGRKRVRNFPFLIGQGVWIDSENLGIDDELAEVLKHGTLSVGFIGLAEALVALTGQHHGESASAQELGLRIVSFLRGRCDAAAAETGLNFSLLATPAEGLSGRFVHLDRERFGRLDGITDRNYYTNSFHVPVYYQTSVANKIDLEAPYHSLTNAGHITYVELDGDPLANVDAFESVVRYMHQAGIGYGSINHPVDRDPICGFTGVIGDECPGCGRVEAAHPFERIRRITGYLVGTLDRWGDGKRAEEADRVKHD